MLEKERNMKFSTQTSHIRHGVDPERVTDEFIGKIGRCVFFFASTYMLITKMLCL